VIFLSDFIFSACVNFLHFEIFFAFFLFCRNLSFDLFFSNANGINLMNTNEQNVCECDKCVNALIGLSIYRDDCVGSLCFVVITVCALQLRLIFQFDFIFICSRDLFIK